MIERDMLTVLALTNEPAGRTEWTRLLRAAGVHWEGKTISAHRMARFSTRFDREGAIVLVELSATEIAYRVPTHLSFTYLEDAESEGRLDKLHRAVQWAKGFSKATHWGYSYGRTRWIRYGTELRVAIVRRDASRAREALDTVSRFINTKPEREMLAVWLVDTIGSDAPTAWIELLGDTHGSTYLDEVVHGAMEFLAYLSPAVLELASRKPARRLEVARYLTASGRASEAAALTLPNDAADVVALLSAFWEGDRPRAVQAGKAAVSKMTKRRKYRQLRDIEGLCYALAQVEVSHEDPAEWEALGRSAGNATAAKAGFPAAYNALGLFHCYVRTGRKPYRGELEEACGLYEGTWQNAPWPTVLTVGLVHVWLGKPEVWVREQVHAWVESARASEFERVGVELSAVLDALEGRSPPANTLASAYHEREPWEVALDTLEGLAAGLTNDPASASPTSDEHIVWEVSLGERVVVIEPRVVSGPRAKRGKRVSIAKMLEGKVEGVSTRDRHVLSFVDFVDIDPRARRVRKAPVLRARALLGLVDHPHVVRKGGAPLLVSRGEPGLRVDSAGDELCVTMQPPSLATAAVAFEEPSSGHVVVYERTAPLEQIARALGGSALRLPDRARERLGKILGGLSSTVRVSAAADIEIAGEDRPADSRAVVLLRWDGTTMHARLRVAPLGLDGPHLLPGEGGVTVWATVDGRALRTRRDFDAERRSLGSVLDACPTLAGLPARHGEIEVGDLFTALEVLLELDLMGDAIMLAWPRGQRLTTPKVRGVSDMRVRVREAGEWLTVSVQLPVDEDLVLGFRELLERRHGRFIELGPERFVALTEDLLRRIDALEGLGKVQKKGLVTSLVTLPLVAELTRDAAKLTLDAASRKRLDGVERAARLTPRVPRAFKAELRDYQREGFAWMARLAEAGLGACLADDMGLGKTVQTLALLVSRAERGPALVVAPTSVASNWIDEARRFAPSLRAVALGPTDRETLIEGLGPNDVLVCSYGLLVTEAERLSGMRFDTVVFDEAHLLKNARTKRARAASGLTATFRLSLTGTPIENHLGELWSLMQATVPGLLGSDKHFEQRFRGPISEGDRERARQLRALLRPFLLRRTKAQVLDELPPRTEVTVRVTPTAEERAFYEALRRAAIEQLDDVSANAKGRLQILAQIMRLRQAAVDPRLLDADAPRGAKVDALMERLIALRAEGHRALVFSQFLGGMQLVRAGLDAAGIPYLSLDGSTPARERAKLIASFQDGEADVFVMSLKAGGVGVNLTGADYVIHLDPWWNPAVEDQATSRSHRIGQERPVTVYRLVTQGTIEEKILELHRDKRELARDLLGQMDRAKKLDLDELRSLL